MHTQEKHGNYSCDHSFEEIGDVMVNNLGWGCYFIQNGQGMLSKEVMFKLELKKKKKQKNKNKKNNLWRSRGRTFQPGDSC